MAIFDKAAKRTLFFALLVIVLSPIAILTVRFNYIHYVLGEDVALLPGGCDTVLETIKHLAGEDFLIRYVNCDTLAKDNAVEVYVLSKSAWGVFLGHKTLLFKYDPGTSDDLPSINIPQSNTIVISNPHVSSIYSKKNHWDHFTVAYNIPQIDFR